MRDDHPSLFDLEDFDKCLSEWKGMPEYSHRDLEPYRQIIVSFEHAGAVEEFARVIGQKITPNQKSVWYPEVKIGRYFDKRYAKQ